MSWLEKISHDDLFVVSLGVFLGLLVFAFSVALGYGVSKYGWLYQSNINPLGILFFVTSFIWYSSLLSVLFTIRFIDRKE